jgi:hypothetical protein
MNTNILLTSGYVNEKVEDFHEVLENTLIERGRNGEVQLLMEEDDDDLEDEYLLRLCKERENERIIHNVLEFI